MPASFELPLDVLRSRRSNKWGRFAPDVLPAWVADMDFAPAYPIQRAMERLVREQDYGYAQRLPSHELYLANAFATRMQSRFGWTVDTALVQPLADLVQGTFAALWAFSDPGDGVILQLPSYPPFQSSIAQTGRRLIGHILPDGPNGFGADAEGLAALVDGNTKIILLCNPQNPTGRAYDRAELEAIGQIACERDLVIVSDEIHADLVYDGRRHIPTALVSPEVAARTITITSATKSFNMPGMRCGVMHFGSAALRERFHKRLPGRIMGSPGVLGLDTTVAAWTESQPWLDDVLIHLQKMRDRVLQFLRAEIPEIAMHVPQATYLAWLDCSALKLPTSAFDFFHDKARVGFSEGQAFLPNGQAHVRFNFATTTRILDEILDRMKTAVRAR